jgi:hypothetical protein
MATLPRRVYRNQRGAATSTPRPGPAWHGEDTALTVHVTLLKNVYLSTYTIKECLPIYLHKTQDKLINTHAQIVTIWPSAQYIQMDLVILYPGPILLRPSCTHTRSAIQLQPEQRQDHTQPQKFHIMRVGCSSLNFSKIRNLFLIFASTFLCSHRTPFVLYLLGDWNHP